MKMKRPPQSYLVTASLARSLMSMAVNEVSPWTATTSAPSWTAMFDFPLIWSTRYWDMLFSSLSPRETIVTLRAWFAKNIDACPAELPAPITCTSRPCVLGASLRAAP